MNNKNTNPLPFYKVNLYLSVEAMDFLSETSNGTSHYAILNQLIKNTCTQASETSKRGNTIKLRIGQVECSVHSYCEQFGIKRKKFENIMHRMEQLGVIRMHRSRLATVADMLCIDSWQLNDDTIISNDVRFASALPHADEQPKRDYVISPDLVSVSEMGASNSCAHIAQSPTDTEQQCPQEASATPAIEQPPSTIFASSNTVSQTNQAKPQEPALDSFGGQYSLDNAPNGEV